MITDLEYCPGCGAHKVKLERKHSGSMQTAHGCNSTNFNICGGCGLRYIIYFPWNEAPFEKK